MVCSHGRSHELFTDTIEVKISGNCTYVGHKWDRTYANLTELTTQNCDADICPEVGINAINYHYAQGETYFVPTSESSHYCGTLSLHKSIYYYSKESKLLMNFPWKNSWGLYKMGRLQ